MGLLEMFIKSFGSAASFIKENYEQNISVSQPEHNGACKSTFGHTIRRRMCLDCLSDVGLQHVGRRPRPLAYVFHNLGC